MCLISSIITAVVLKDTKGLLAYDEEALNSAALEKQNLLQGKEKGKEGGVVGGTVEDKKEK